MTIAIIHCDQINQVKQENGVIQIGSNKNSDKKHYVIGLEEYYIFKVIRKNVICGNGRWVRVNYYFAGTYQRSWVGCGARSVFSNGVRMYFAGVRGCDMLRLACYWVVVSSFFAVACYSFAEVLFNNYSSSPNGLRVNSPFGLRPHELLTQRAMRARWIIVLVKSN